MSSSKSLRDNYFILLASNSILLLYRFKQFISYYPSGILQKGDGTNVYLKHKPRVIITTMGDGRQRELECGDNCSGVASKQRLLAPVALTAAPDGSIFVGDFNLVRKISPDGTVRTVVKLK